MDILIVDDNLTYLHQMKKYLSLHNLKVEIAKNGEEAFTKMTKSVYDVVILDLKMPDFSGIEILQWANEQDLTSNFIVITGYGSVETAVKAMKLGAIDYLQKPFEPQTLFHLIKKVGKGPPVSTTPDIFPRGSLKGWLQGLCKGKPVLLMTDQNPEDFCHQYGITVTESIQLTSKPGQDAIDPKKTVTLRHRIQDFATAMNNVVIIHGGLSTLITLHGKIKIQEYLDFLHALAEKENFQLIILYQSVEEKEILQALENIPSSTFIDDVVKIFDHDIRCHILNILGTRKTLHYTDFLKEMDIDISSNLAFHLKKLMKLDLIEKKADQYVLTPRGRYFVDILHSLTVGKYRDPSSNILYYPL
jgi:YesN/AraC family two-component response regulator